MNWPLWEYWFSRYCYWLASLANKLLVLLLTRVSLSKYLLSKFRENGRGTETQKWEPIPCIPCWCSGQWSYFISPYRDFHLEFPSTQMEFCHLSCSLVQGLDIKSLELWTSLFNKIHMPLVWKQVRVSCWFFPLCTTYWTNEPRMKWASWEGWSHFSSCHYEAWLTHFSQIRKMSLPLFQVRQELDRKCKTSFVHGDYFSLSELYRWTRTGHDSWQWLYVNEKWLPVRTDERFILGPGWKSMMSARLSSTRPTCASVMLRLREYSGHEAADHLWLNFCYCQWSHVDTLKIHTKQNKKVFTLASVDNLIWILQELLL